MLSASFNNQTQNQNLRYNLSDNPMNDFSSNPMGYHENYIPKPDMYNQFYNQTHFLAPGINNYDSKMYSISESDSIFQPSNISNNHNNNNNSNNNNSNNNNNNASLINPTNSVDYNLSHLDQSTINNNNNLINSNNNINHISAGNGKDFDFSALSSRLNSITLKPNCSVSRSNSAHNSPFDNRVTPRPFPQSTSNTPLPLASRLNRDMDMMRGNPPIMQLFPSSVGTAGNTGPVGTNGNGNPGINSNNNNNGNNNGGCCNIGNMSGGNNNAALVGSGCYSINRSSPVELIEYQSMASKMGFLVGQDLDEVLNRSATMKNSNSSRISNFFKHKHGSSGNHLSQKQYLVLGVRVPSKEHVSEIVGKEGKKIKMIRQTTGALIATPNEKEDHVFLIEAVPETAIKVGQIIQQLADQITRNKLGNITGLMGERPRSPPMLGNRTPLATATIGVPQRLVGKVIGTQGSIITTVQKETGTEIKSPPKDELRAPGDTADFEISVYENGTVNSEETAWLQIHRAKQLIAHLVMRVWDQQPRNSTPSSDEGTGGGSSAPLNSNFSSPEWMWTEVSRMDDGDAKEIIDRILRSSKAKITPSTSSTEGTNIDSLVAMQQQQSTPQQAPPLSSSSITQSVPISASLSSSCSASSSSPPLSQSISAAGGYHYKLLPSEELHWTTTTANRQINNDCCYSTDPIRSRINPHLHNNGLYYSPHQQQYSSSHATHNHHHLQHSLINNNQYCSSNNNNDSAFYDSYYPSVYSPPSLISHPNGTSYISDIIDSPTPPTIIPSHNNHHQQSIDSSWPKQVFFSSSVNNSVSNQILHTNGGINNSNSSDDNTRYVNVRYLWKNTTHDASLSPSPYLDSASVPVGSSSPPSSSATSWMPMNTNHSPTSNGMIQLRQNNPNNSNNNRVSESLFGTIGDGRKRNSVASNSDDREDL